MPGRGDLLRPFVASSVVPLLLLFLFTGSAAADAERVTDCVGGTAWLNTVEVCAFAEAEPSAIYSFGGTFTDYTIMGAPEPRLVVEVFNASGEVVLQTERSWGNNRHGERVEQKAPPGDPAVNDRYTKVCATLYSRQYLNKPRACAEIS